jgi:hypothetical protein
MLFRHDIPEGANRLVEGVNIDGKKDLLIERIEKEKDDYTE